jgi:hypothetical protein
MYIKSGVFKDEQRVYVRMNNSLQAHKNLVFPSAPPFNIYFIVSG